jgi:hypothetical protein
LYRTMVQVDRAPVKPAGRYLSALCKPQCKTRQYALFLKAFLYSTMVQFDRTMPGALLRDVIGHARTRQYALFLRTSLYSTTTQTHGQYREFSTKYQGICIDVYRRKLNIRYEGFTRTAREAFRAISVKVCLCLYRVEYTNIRFERVSRKAKIERKASFSMLLRLLSLNRWRAEVPFTADGEEERRGGISSQVPSQHSRRLSGHK